jgi:hypothetical protein
MAGAVGAAVGVVSTVAGMGEQGRQRSIAKKTAEVQQYAQEVQYTQELMAIKQQKEYARQTRQLEDSQLRAQDLQMSNALQEQVLQARGEENNLAHQVEMKTVSDLQQLSAANSQLDNAQYQLGEQQRGRNAQADSRQSEQVGQIDQTSQQVAKYLSEGNQQAAAAALMNASMGQQDSKSSDLQTDRRSEVTNTLRTLMQQGTLTDEAVRQALYEKDVAATLKDAGMYDVLMERMGAQSQFDVNASTLNAQRDLLTTGKQKNKIGEDLASKTLSGGIALRDTQRNIDTKFGDMGFSAQGDNAGIRNAGIMSSLQAQQAASSGSLFTTLANTAALAGSLYNGYQQIAPTKSYSSPVRGASGTQGTNTPTRPKFGPAF